MSIDSENRYLAILACLLIALASMLGSLFFSEIMGFSPCALCWYQRIAMYPLVLIFLVGMFQPIKSTINFALPIVSTGLFIAIYHNLLHYGIVPETASPCRAGVPCSTVYINWLGFITIPMLSAISFVLILAILLILQKREKNEK
jgi:disulfide bond formation protein DsbB